METQKFLTHSEDETEQLGYEFAENLQTGDVIALYGDLGSGKTSFIKGVCRFFEVKEPVTSPTFTIMNQYQISKNDEIIMLYHIDLYRINEKKELLDIGFDECLADDSSIKFIEWAEKAGDLDREFNYRITIGSVEGEDDGRSFEIAGL